MTENTLQLVKLQYNFLCWDPAPTHEKYTERVRQSSNVIVALVQVELRKNLNNIATGLYSKKCFKEPTNVDEQKANDLFRQDLNGTGTGTETRTNRLA